MKILLKSCKIIQPESKDLNNIIKDILIVDSKITKIEDSIEAEVDQVIEATNLHVSNGWIDGKVNFCDPGNEHKEDLNSGIELSEKGGFTGVFLTPNTQPRISGKSQLEYVIKKSQFSPVRIYPFGTVTENMAGENLAEMYDMQENGAIGFTDCTNELSSGILYRALLYTKQFVSKVVSFPLDSGLSKGGMVNEGEASIQTGLKSITHLAEYSMVKRDLDLLEYTNSQLHLSGISTKESVELIRNAKKNGFDVTCDVYLSNLVYTEKEIPTFNSYFKVLPPLRTEEDRQALLEGLKEGTIDYISSNHTPEDTENKDLEFDLAEYGVIGTQTLFAQLNTQTDLPLELIVEKLTTGPKKAFNLHQDRIAVGEIANLTLFDPSVEWEYSTKVNSSKSLNSPELDKKLKGQVIGIINNGSISICN